MGLESSVVSHNERDVSVRNREPRFDSEWFPPEDGRELDLSKR